MKTLMALLGITAGTLWILQARRNAHDRTLGGQTAILGGRIAALFMDALESMQCQLESAFESLKNSTKKESEKLWKEAPKLRIVVK